MQYDAVEENYSHKRNLFPLAECSIYVHIMSEPSTLLGASAQPNGSTLFTSAYFDMLAKYHRLSVTGIENIPRDGPTVFISNHSGFLGLDALLLRRLIFEEVNASPRILLHRLWFFSRTTRSLARRMGFIEAKYQFGINALKNGLSILLFPEGAHGNFKPYSQKYKLQKFKSGFVRMAVNCNCPISPILILGPEESHINLRKIDLSFLFQDTALPLPLNILPLPAKWKVHFLEPIFLSRHASESETIDHHVQSIQALVQNNINEFLQERGNPFI